MNCVLLCAGQAGSPGMNDSGVDHRALEVAINELLGLCRVAEEYNQVGGGRGKKHPNVEGGC